MSENFYVDSICTEEVKRSREAAIALDTYVIAEAIRSYRINTEIENSNTKGGDTAWSRCYRLAVVCLVLLCVLLLTAVTLLWIKLYILNTENTQLQTSNNNLTKERNQLQTSYNNVTIERDQLQTSYNNLTIERDQLQTSYNNLTKKRDQLQREKFGYLRTFCDLYKGSCFSFNSSLYFMSNEMKNWTESRQDCKNKGADLVIINNKDKQEFITKLLSYRTAWIGLSGKVRENKWKWVDDTPLSTGFWASGQPDSKAGDADCVVTNYYPYYFYTVRNWADVLCNNKFMWICETTVFN